MAEPKRTRTYSKRFSEGVFGIARRLATKFRS